MRRTRIYSKGSYNAVVKKRRKCIFCRKLTTRQEGQLGHYLCSKCSLKYGEAKKKRRRLSYNVGDVYLDEQGKEFVISGEDKNNYYFYRGSSTPLYRPKMKRSGYLGGKPKKESKMDKSSFRQLFTKRGDYVTYGGGYI